MRRMISLKQFVLILLAVCVMAATGCDSTLRNTIPSTWRGAGASDKDLTIQSRTHPDAVPIGGFDQGIYTLDDPSSITVLLTDGPADDPERALIIRMFWRPVAVATPLDETATNATVQYIVFNQKPDGSDQPRVGLYSGGGFLYPENETGSPTLQANLWQATLTLATASEGFEDDLGASIMKGRFTAHRDDEGIVEALRQVNIAVSEGLGRPRFVMAD